MPWSLFIVFGKDHFIMVKNKYLLTHTITIEHVFQEKRPGTCVNYP